MFSFERAGKTGQTGLGADDVAPVPVLISILNASVLMKAALLESYRAEPKLANVPDPACPRDGVIVGVRACGVCRSDHHAWQGVDPDVELPHVMGHEFSGEVIEVGADCHRFQVGDRVTAPFILGCGHCPDCQTGQPTVCSKQQVIGFSFWGAFAEAVAIPHADYNLVRLPEAVSFEDAAGMGCRVTTAWRALTDRAGLKPGEWVVVHGCGGVGLSAILIAAALGARILAVDVSEAALTQARLMGANETLNVSGIGDVGAVVRDITEGGAHVSLDALGVSATFDNSLRSLRKLGRHIQVGMPVGDHAAVTLPLLELVYARQLSLHGMRGLGATGFPALFDMISAGRLNLGGLVTRTLPLSQLGNALREMDGTQPAGVTVINRMTA
ncbi:alcohol dehydrogenase catalytic domain-containing protein [Shimia thalassica]|uniref:alcohol dehydrogenase catalytic domain-containing protein n=1 Tax=Shimia thalassica TaxID=1715693 RepID=UPI0026E3CEB4|nr:alcohol dehydrogenase catalytic domain-containing protein [Shimia thalassica]MDO6479562.1 alcohol dehydrogenase catalytic domain-containing protein [Shimia thalassica]